jgi:hypothetical protein
VDETDVDVDETDVDETDGDVDETDVDETDGDVDETDGPRWTTLNCSGWMASNMPRIYPGPLPRVGPAP